MCIYVCMYQYAMCNVCMGGGGGGGGIARLGVKLLKKMLFCLPEPVLLTDGQHNLLHSLLSDDDSNYQQCNCYHNEMGSNSSTH